MSLGRFVAKGHQLNSFFANSRLRISVLKRKFTHGLVATVLWSIRGSAVPTPNFIKRKTIRDKFYSDAVCVETGTYLGETTKWLSRNFSLVFSLEPQEKLFNFNVGKFRRNTKVRLFRGTSEEKLGEVLSQIKNGANVNFWLDGHFSGGMTYEGVTNSPIVQELLFIKSELNRFRNIVIAIDDFRDFQMQIVDGYPDRSWLVNWALENQFSWDVRNDIFFMERLQNQ